MRRGSLSGGAVTRWRLFAALIAIACVWPVGSTHAGLRLQLDTTGLTPDQIAASNAALDAAIGRLPPSLVAGIDHDIAVRWSDALPHDATGRARRHAVLLNRRLLAGLDQQSPDAALAPISFPLEAGNGSPRRPSVSSAPAVRDEVVATVLHELTHIYDRSAQLSSDARLLDLAGWQVKAKRPRARAAANRFVDRTPNPYELTSPREFVAVNLEYFLLDADYACRRPALHRYFAAHFGWAPSHPTCEVGLTYVAAASHPAASAASDTPPGRALATLDPSRVQAVEYLLADANSEPMSRWGHSMLRLVVCAPGRARGPDCRLDLQHHLVLSFRAFVDDVQLSSWRGLSGSYPSRLFVLPLEQIVDEYTRDQLRALQSIPLQLERAEIAMLLERAAQLHWSYDGRYYFVTNNCAVETFKLLHDGVPRLAVAGLDAITPGGLLRKLDRRGIADTAVLGDPDEARRLGYRFDSLRERYQAMFDIARQELGLNQTGVEDWLKLPASERRTRFDVAGLRATAALLVLEESARRQQLILARQELKRRYLGSRTDTANGGFDDADATLQQILVESGFLSRPAGLLAGQSGYGLPQPSEISSIQALVDVRSQRLADLGGQLADEVQPLLDPAMRTELAAVADNLTLLGARMRTLNRRAGGIELP